MELDQNQRTALEKMHNGCILNGGVGSGKSITSLSYYVKTVCGGSLTREHPMTRPTNLLILTPAKKRDKLEWQEEMLHLGLFMDPELSYGNTQIVIDSWHNIGKYADLEGWFILCDEQKLTGNGAWVKTFLKLVKKNEWVMLSATPADHWIDYIPVFVANGFYKNRTEFIENHVVWRFTGKYPEIRGYFGARLLRQHRDAILVDLPYERHTIRHLIHEICSFDIVTYDRVWKKRWNVYTDEPLVDSAEMHRIGRRVVNSDPSRLDKLAELSADHPRMIIAYTFDYELELLRTLHSRLDIPVAEWNGHRHEEIPETESWLYLVQMQSAAEAWNCITTDTLIFYSLPYSHKIYEQLQGRIDRRNTPFIDLFYYILRSEASIDKRIWKALSMKKDFHESRNERFLPKNEEISSKS